MSKEKEKEEKVAKHVRVIARPTKKASMKRRKLWVAKPVKEEPRMTQPSTVKGKIEAIQREKETMQIKKGDIQKSVADILIGVQAMRTSINDQIKENRDASAAFYTDVGELYDSVLAQAKENAEAAAAIFSGAREIQVGIGALQSSINEKIKENVEYVKNFYG
jgi:predicted  nucleic acid-binding Zn-ribbon protein